jgi:steroid delta-isomerase-like uncharacterized protein
MRFKMAMAMAMVLMAAGPGRAGEAPAAPADPKLVVNAFYQAVNAHNFDSMAKYLITDFVDHNPDPGQAPGSYGVQKAFEEMYKAFPDLKIQVQQIVAEGDLVVARVSMVGTHKGPYMGMAATGKPFRMGGIDMVRVKNGKATERWGYFDVMALQQQLAPAKK